MDIRLIALDVDGTLVNSKKELTKATAQAIQKATEQGIHVCICTGRPYTECAEYYDRLPGVQYIVHCTGAQVTNLHTGETIYRNALTADEQRMLYKIISKYDIVPDIFDEENRILNRASDWADEGFWGIFIDTVRRNHIPVEDLDAHVENYTGMTNKIHMYFRDISHKAPLWEELNRLPYAVMESEALDLEIMPLGIHKGVGLQKLAEFLGLDASQVMVIGDGGNDVGMFQYAGTAIAMKNASEEAKAAAHRVSQYTNDEDGVAKEILAVLKGEPV